MNAELIRGQPPLAADPVSTQRCERALELMHTHRGDPSALLGQLLADDPHCVAGHSLRAGLIVRNDDARKHSELRASLAAIAAARPEDDHATRRHAAAARAWLEGDSALALARYGAMIDDNPRDLLALIVAHALDFRLGRRRKLRDRPARALRSWDPTMPGFASVLAMYAFGLEENGRYDRAEEVACRALAIDPEHVGAMHARVHVMEMQGRARDGLAFLAAHEPVWSEGNGFAVHLAWHQALFHLELDDVAAALAVHDRQIATARPGDVSALIDASALLWRLELRGIATSVRWKALSERWERQHLVAARPFHVAHAMMAFAAAKRAGATAGVLDMLRSADAAAEPARPPEHALARPFCNALVAFASRKYAQCVEWLAQVRRIAYRCGGSVAQCDLVHLTFTEAALRARKTDLATSLVAERATRKPSSPLNRLLKLRARSAIPAPT